MSRERQCTITVPVHRFDELALRTAIGDGEYGELRFKATHTFGLGSGSMFIEIDGEPFWEVHFDDIARAILSAAKEEAMSTATITQDKAGYNVTFKGRKGAFPMDLRTNDRDRALQYARRYAERIIDRTKKP
jgi:hypothetical protein